MRHTSSVSFLPTFDTVVDRLKDGEHRSSQQQRQLIETLQELDQMDVVQELLKDSLLKPGVLVHFARAWLTKPRLHSPQFKELKEHLAKAYAHEVQARWNGEGFSDDLDARLNDTPSSFPEDVDLSFENPASLLRYFQEVGPQMNAQDQLIVLLRNLPDIEEIIVFLNDPELLRVLHPECVVFFQRHQLLVTIQQEDTSSEEEESR